MSELLLESGGASRSLSLLGYAWNRVYHFSQLPGSDAKQYTRPCFVFELHGLYLLPLVFVYPLLFILTLV